MGRLVLTRRRGQRVRIGTEIWVAIGRIDGAAVELVIEAPGEVPIVREEVIPRLAVETIRNRHLR